MSRSRPPRKADAPEVAAMLRKLDEAMIGVAPVSHFSTDPRDRQSAGTGATQLPIGAALGPSSALRSHQRDTFSDVFRKFGTGETVDRVSMANSMRFAVDHDSIGAAVKFREGADRGLRVQLGVSTLPGGIASAGSVPADAEVRKLCGDMAAAPSADAVLFKTFADTSTLGQRKAPLRDTVAIVLAASGASPHYASMYNDEHKYTPEMQAAVKSRDTTHALKADEEKRYAEEKIRFNKMLGVGGGDKKAGGAPVRKAGKA